MKRKLAFILFAALMLTPWPVAYAYDNTAVGQPTVQIEAAETAAAPQWQAFGNAIGGVTPGDLFYIDSTNSTADLPVTLLITNTDELVRRYRYLTLKVGAYVQTDTGQWREVTASNGQASPDTYITMLNARASFMLPGYARYKITIDRGCFYSYGTSTTADGSNAAPDFYLAVEQ